MSQPAFAPPAPAPFLHRAFDWSLEQVKHVLPATIFFFVGFNLILWTKRLILEEQGVEFSGFFTATPKSRFRSPGPLGPLCGWEWWGDPSRGCA